MSQNVTPANDTPLSGNKRIAVEQLATGERVTAAAVAAGVARETVHRWLKTDPLFQAALNETRTEIRDAAERRLLVAAEKAAENLVRAVESGDVKTSLGVLRGLGLLSGTALAIGSTEPDVVAEEQQLLDAERKQNLTLRRMMSIDLTGL